MKLKKAAAVLCAASMLSVLTACPVATVSAAGEMREISSMELVRDMGIGINIGNTFEACGDWIAEWGDGTVQSYETAWGSPVITKEMIDGYAKAGFGVLRIPVAWSNMMVNDGTYTINKEWDKRIHEVVDWTIADGMYAIINIHWDNGWVNTFPENKDECMKRYKRMWTQICESFQDYSDYLMFESQNEELGWEQVWNVWQGDNGKAESYQLCNEINQAFVDVVRNSGGNNPKRHLLISGYNTGIDRVCDPFFKMPNDPANRCAISVHYYAPADFAILEEDADWAKMRSTWGTDSDFAYLREQMQMMKTNYIDKGIPVIIGEYGCPIKNKDINSVRLFVKSVCQEAYSRQLCPILWDVTDAQYDRTACQMKDSVVADSLRVIGGKEFNPQTTTSATTTTTTTTETTTVAPPSTLYGDCNMDGKLSIADVLLLQRHLLGDSLTDCFPDMNQDGKVTAVDLSLLKQRLLG